MATVPSVQFVLRQKTDIDHLFELLDQEYPLHKNYMLHLQRQYLDSFDWRLHQEDYAFGIDSYNNECNFFIYHKEADSSVCEIPLDKIPRFSHDIPRQSCRKLLNDILGVRALITVATIHIRCRELLYWIRKAKHSLCFEPKAIQLKVKQRGKHF